MAHPHLTAGECIRRALSASEIAESCPEPSLRRSFVELTSTWLQRAEAQASARLEAGSAREERLPSA